MSDQTPLLSLAHNLEVRWRIRRFTGHVGNLLVISTAISFVLLVLEIAFFPMLPVWRLILVVNGAAIALSLILAAIQRRTPLRLLSDADRVYDTKELLTSAADFQQTGFAVSDSEYAFRKVVITRGEAFAPDVKPATVYPISAPRRAPIVAAILAALAIVVLLDTSGWFGGPHVELAQEGFLIEDAARRLAERSNDEELQDLADQLQRLGKSLQDGQLDADEARRRIDQLAERVEDQVRDLERLGEFDTNQDIEFPEDAESAVRSALRSGMSEGEVLEYFMSLRSDGENLPDVLNQLEEARLDRPPDADVNLDDERVRDLMDQLNLNPETTVPSEMSEDLEFARQTLQNAGEGVQELSAGDEDGFGEPGEGQTNVRGGSGEEASDAGRATDGPGNQGQSGGDRAVADAMDDTFNRIEETNPLFRQIEGVVAEGTIRDVIVRELPSEAISQLDEAEREVAFETVIEEAVGREDVPPELQQLLRNYFLRITLGSDQGETDEQ